MDVSFFANEKYKILVCMQERQINVLGNTYVPLSQRQIAEITEISYRTVNNVIKDLRGITDILQCKALLAAIIL